MGGARSVRPSGPASRPLGAALRWGSRRSWPGPEPGGSPRPQAGGPGAGSAWLLAVGRGPPPPPGLVRLRPRRTCPPRPDGRASPGACPPFPRLSRPRLRTAFHCGCERPRARLRARTTRVALASRRPSRGRCFEAAEESAAMPLPVEAVVVAEEEEDAHWRSERSPRRAHRLQRRVTLGGRCAPRRGPRGRGRSCACRSYSRPSGLLRPQPCEPVATGRQPPQSRAPRPPRESKPDAGSGFRSELPINKVRTAPPGAPPRGDRVHGPTCG